MSKLLLITAAAANLLLTGCATVTMEQAVTIHNTVRAAAMITQPGLQAELLQGLYYAR